MALFKINTLATYSTSSSTMANYNATRTSSSNKPISSVSKRKHDDIDGTRCEFCSISVNDQTKFVISYIIPGKCANIANSDQEISKQFQTKFSHLFTYIPDEYIQSYLIDNTHVKPQKSKICLMLYDDIVTFMNESDLQLSGISLDQAFTLPNSILQHIHSYVH
ncbi:unnamed protein product [Adineta ricciae]|uniref:Uncharacterized protein n=2 Tax=Adineta ricciae TaxID=249248 RepID=A0A814T6Z5_ADIRI|nr:unnamed protein product [Adineta ricciae]